MLECRVFIPKTFQAGTALPLYIDIHGGAFLIGSPSLDDKYCHYLCNQFNFIVVSIEYRLGPTYPFPIQGEDCVELILAILADKDLPTVPGAVALGGMSAGGNLTLSAAQDPRLQSKIKALVPIYPAVDFSHRFTGDYRDIPADASGKGGAKDGLRGIVPLAEFAYLSYGQDLTDPRLSPIYAERRLFPDRIYIIAAQHDKLCTEAINMARMLADNDQLREEDDWEENGIRWERVPNEIHGFIEGAWQDEISGKVKTTWKQGTQDVIHRIGEWLQDVFKNS